MHLWWAVQIWTALKRRRSRKGEKEFLRMKVSELIANLTTWAAQSPENSSAEVMLQFFDDMVYGIAGANDARGMGGQHLLIIVPDMNARIGVRELKIQ